jgi:formate dehydrogenase iron-sulfur subunit
MSETAPQPTTAAANPPVQPMASNLLPSDVVRISATLDVPQPDRQLTKVAKLIDVSKCIG